MKQRIIFVILWTFFIGLNAYKIGELNGKLSCKTTLGVDAEG